MGETPTQGFGDEEQASPKTFSTRFLGTARAAPAGGLESLEHDCVGLTEVTSRMLQWVEGLAFPLHTTSTSALAMLGRNVGSEILDQTLHLCPWSHSD